MMIRAPEREKHLVQEKLKEAEAGLFEDEEVPEGEQYLEYSSDVLSVL